MFAKNLSQPYPAHTRRSAFRMAAAMGAFVAVFLLLFQPFGLQQVPGGSFKVFAVSGYGFITFACVSLLALACPALYPAWFRAQQWTVGKEVLFTLLNISCVGLANFIYTALVFRHPLSPGLLLNFQLITLTIGTFPVLFLVLLRHNRLLAQNLKLAQEMNTGLAQHPQQEQVQQEMLFFTSETGQEPIVLKPQDFLFAAAAGNYVELYCLENGVPKKNLIRSSLSRVEEAVQQQPQMVRCHRSYLVNLEQVRSFSGNAQGLLLELQTGGYSIQVSRKMVPQIKSLL